MGQSTHRLSDATGGSLEVSVTDTGIGIPAEDLGRIFEEFEQVADRTRPRQEGTGLGLALVKKLVELHGGAIRVSSAPGQGSTFTFTVPIATA
jgi:signal transduction histidine kinase